MAIMCVGVVYSTVIKILGVGLSSPGAKKAWQ